LVGKTLWVVDDDDEVRSMVSRTLTMLGHSVHTSSDGISALAELSTTQVEIDLLITDILMPGLDGLQLVERLYERRPAMNVLFMSGYPAEHYRDIVDRERPFLQKPFRTHQLTEQLSHLFSPAPYA
jgi:two-component system cell cycle sensor histidine kinase/response regulator CckA